MTKRRKTAGVLCLVLLLVVFCFVGGYFLTVHDGSPVNRAAYDRVQLGMAKEEAYEIMGGGPTTLHHAYCSVVDAEETEPFFKGRVGQETTLANYDNFWAGSTYLIHIDTRDGKVCRKVLFRLEGRQRSMIERVADYVRALLP